MLNQGDDITVGGLNTAIPLVKDEAYMNMDRLNSNEDKVPVKDEVPVREGKTTGLEDEVSRG